MDLSCLHSHVWYMLLTAGSKLNASSMQLLPAECRAFGTKQEAYLLLDPGQHFARHLCASRVIGAPFDLELEDALLVVGDLVNEVPDGLAIVLSAGRCMSNVCEACTTSMLSKAKAMHDYSHPSVQLPAIRAFTSMPVNRADCTHGICSLVDF